MNYPNRQYRFLRRILRIAFKMMYKINVTGLENFKKDENVVIIANHNSWVDPLLIFAYLPEVKIGLLAEATSALSAPWIQRFIKACELNIVLVNRGSQKSRLKGMYEAKKIIKSGDSFMIFPEGRVNIKDSKMYPFFAGAFALALKNKKDILPIYIRGNEDLYIGRKVNFSVGEVIRTTGIETAEDLARMTYSYMEDNVKPEKPENVEPKKKYLNISKMFLGEMADEYDTDDVVVRGNDAAKLFNKVNFENRDKYDQDSDKKKHKLIKSFKGNY